MVGIRNLFGKKDNSGLTNDDFRKVLKDIHGGVKSKDKRKELRKQVDNYIAVRLDYKEEIKEGSGVFATKFKHIVFTNTPDAVLHTGEKRQTREEILKVLAGEALDYVKNPASEAKVNVFTLDDVLNKQDPSIGADLKYELPLAGADGHGNPVFLMHGSHPAIGDLADLLEPSEDRKDVPLHNDDFAWARAAWLSALMQLDAEQIREKFKDKPAAVQLVNRIADMAAVLKDTEGFRHSLVTTDGKTTLTYTGDTQGNFEDDLEAATRLLFENKHDCHGKPLNDPADGKYVTSHVFSLMNELGAKAVVQGNGTDGIGAHTLGVSFPGADKKSDDLTDEDEASHATRMKELCGDLPILVRTADGGYSIRMPTQAKKEASDSSSADASSAAQGAPGSKSTDGGSKASDPAGGTPPGGPDDAKSTGNQSPDPVAAAEAAAAVAGVEAKAAQAREKEAAETAKARREEAEASDGRKTEAKTKEDEANRDANDAETAGAPDAAAKRATATAATREADAAATAAAAYKTAADAADVSKTAAKSDREAADDAANMAGAYVERLTAVVKARKDEADARKHQANVTALAAKANANAVDLQDAAFTAVTKKEEAEAKVEKANKAVAEATKAATDSGFNPAADLAVADAEKAATEASVAATKADEASTKAEGAAREALNAAAAATAVRKAAEGKTVARKTEAEDAERAVTAAAAEVTRSADAATEARKVALEAKKAAEAADAAASPAAGAAEGVFGAFPT